MSYDHDKWCAETRCEVCNRQGVIGVASSSMGAISFAFCLECAQQPAEPEFMFTFTYHSTGGGNVAEWVRDMYTWRGDRYISWDDWAAYASEHPEEYPDPFADYEPPSDEEIQQMFDDSAEFSR